MLVYPMGDDHIFKKPFPPVYENQRNSIARQHKRKSPEQETKNDVAEPRETLSPFDTRKLSTYQKSVVRIENMSQPTETVG